MQNSWWSLLLNSFLPSPRNVASTLVKFSQDVVRQKIEHIILLERSTLLFGHALRGTIPEGIKVHSIDVWNNFTQEQKELSVDRLSFGESRRIAIVDEYIALWRQTNTLRRLLEKRWFDVYTYGLGGILPSRREKIKIFNPYFRYALVRDIGEEIFWKEWYIYSEKGVELYNYINALVVSVIKEKLNN